MTLHWMVDAERLVPCVTRGIGGTLLWVVDGARDWHPISTAPFNQNLELRLRKGERRSIPFPCRQTRDSWVNGVFSRWRHL
jgi:hypothetical protein